MAYTEQYVPGLQFELGLYKGFGGPVFRVTDYGFEIIVILPDISEKEALKWKTSTIKYGLFTKDEIPFFVGFFGGTIWIDSSFNIKSFPKEERTRWMQLPSMKCLVLLVDSQTSLLKTVREFEVTEEFTNSLKRVMSEQEENYETFKEVEGKISQIQHLYCTSELMMEKVPRLFYSVYNE
ncbi:hypothetical protein PV783_14080 [Chitinophaga sp. CC14]|uniref:hypothetical protein n=1 Tax=Chitinophaga sp. CC14 TaxID=3029199 RepID=UPI003B7F1FF0